ncbi:DUF4179 domain-containing protein [uncultured Clostridium sp.]|uniref:DUF4179 domain-containing protein n=1 Tax=uncultured Clostridium sp. TaxID=59620 RepID=UPI0028E819EC|nr:DUF4179 domain-containing protein [uncultured Clostridium sp.]
MLNDESLKEILSKINTEELPSEVDKKITESFKIIKRKKLNRRVVKYISAASIALLTTVTGVVLYSNPALANQIPILNTLFKEEKLSKYSTAIEAKAEDKGMELSVKEATYDGNDLYIAYILKSDKPLKFKNEDDLITILPHRYNGRDIKFVGTESHGWTYLGNEKIDDYNFIIREKLSLKEFSLPKFEIGIEQRIKRIAGVEGEWNLSFKIDLDSMNEKIRQVKVDRNMNYGYGKLKIKSINISPISSKIIFSKSNIGFNKDESSKEHLKFENEYKFLISDDNGRGLQNTSGRYSYNNVKTKGERKFNIAEDKLPSYLILTPIKRLFLMEHEYFREMDKDDIEKGLIHQDIYKNYIKHGSLDELPITINTKKFGALTINKFEENKEDKYTKLYLTIEEGKFLEVFDGEIGIYDETKPENSRYSYLGKSLFKRIKDNEYIMEIGKYKGEPKLQLDRLNDYKIVTPDFDNLYEIVGEELKIDLE